IDPDNTSALVNLAVVYKLRNELQKSVDLFNKVLSLEPDNTEALYNLNLLKDTIKKQQELTEKLEQPKQISQPAQVAQQHDVESISAQKTQSAPAAQWQLPTLKSDITGKEVSFPLDFKEPYTLETTVKMQLPEEIKPKLSLSSKSETQQPLKQDTIAITLTSNVPTELNEWQKFKSELVSDIKSELSNFLNDLKKILAPASYNVSQKSFGYDDFLFTDNFSTFNFQNNDLLGFSTKADNFDFLNTNDFNFTSVNDFNLSDNFDLSINNFENNNLSFDADGLINFTNLNPFEPELNSSTYWTDNSKSDIFSEAVRQSKPAVQSEQFDWLGIDNSSDFSELLDINELLNDLNQPLENSSFDINLGIDNLNQSTAVSAKNDLFDFTPLNLTDNFTISPAQQPLKTSANIQQTKSTNQSMININTDSEEVLMSKGLPSDIVKNIIWYRSNITKFRMIEDFLTLPNVTQEIYNRFKDRIVF
ncbi:MAG TPA: helix-hairpin-helix domain-containing protein, partial [bacterium]|nr:helix-hairpin-helix domain-containing protein [bacterium]